MSIEAMKQMIELYDKHCHNNDYGGIEFNKKHGYKFNEAIEALRTALSQQPATGEPVVIRNPFASRCYTMSESHLSGHRLIVGFEKLGDAQDAHEWVARQGRGDFTHPAPSVPDDLARDAERYRWLRDHDHWPAPFSSSQEPEPVRGRDLDAAIDAAMLAAK